MSAAPRWLRWAACALLSTAAVGCDDDDATVPPAPEADVGPALDAEVFDQGAQNCLPSPEICDGRDNDCDGLVDDQDDDLQVQLFDDVENCGRCGFACDGANATIACLRGRCYITACEAGYHDYNANAADGCESNCLISNGGREACDGVDNDCDLVADEDFDLDSDPNHCGACGVSCGDAPNGAAACQAGTCVISTCARDYVDLDGDVANGCEYRCTPTNTDQVREFCNGRDDDCDGVIDEGADLQPPEALCSDRGLCAPACAGDGDCDAGDTCNAGGVCVPADGGAAGRPCADDADCQADHPGLACLETHRLEAGERVTERRCVQRTTGAACDGEAGWRCTYPPGYAVGTERGLCDQLDNDCDGRVDEDYADQLVDERGRPRQCEAGRGACRRAAPVTCAPDGLGTVCTAEPAAPVSAVDDTCDAQDDDCDGAIDEDFAQAWVSVGDVSIFAYEASRPGATADRPGLDPDPDDEVTVYGEEKACSQPGVLPWADVTWAEAQTACQAVGARLCTAAEWLRACEAGVAGQAYPYGPRYSANQCNGGEYDVDPQAAGVQDGVLPTGDAAQCVARGVFDLSGNLKEWTDAIDGGLRPVRGGGFESNAPGGLTCQQTGDLKPPGLRSPSLGFRCCR